MKRNRTPTSLALGALATLVVLTSCRDELGPEMPRHVALAFAPVFQGANAGIVPVTAVRITAARQSTGIVVADTVFPLTGQDSVDLGVIVPLVDPTDRFLVSLAVAGTQGDTVFRGGPIELAPSTGGTAGPVPEIPLAYEGIGSDADSVVLTTTAPGLFTGGTFLFQAQAFAGDTVVPGTPIAWSSLDTAQAAVPDPATGQVVAGSLRGTARIVAALLTGPADTGSVFVQPGPASATVPSGDGQTGEVALLLGTPITIRVLGSDGVGVENALVRFTGDGTFSPDTAITDANGDVQTAWTLGKVSGAQTGLATVDDQPAGGQEVLRTTGAGAAGGDKAGGVSAGSADTAGDEGLTHVSVGFSSTGLAGPASVVNVTPVADTLVLVGDTTRFSATADDSLGNAVISPLVTWSLSDSSVASIDSAGLVTALSNGSSGVIATVGAVSDTSSLVVAIVQAAGVHWINAGGGNWSDSASWSTGAPPTAADTVFIDAPGTYTVTVDIAATVAFLNGGATGAQTLAITSQTLTVDSGGTLGNSITLAQSGGTLHGAGSINLSGTYQWTGGSLGLTGAGSLRIDSAGALDLSGTTKNFRNHTLALDGSGTWSAGSINAGSGAVLSIESNGVLDIQDNVTLSYNLGGAAPRVDNLGTILRSAGTATANFNLAFNNHGILDVQSATVTLTQGGVSDGQFLVSTGTILGFNGGTHTLDSNSTLTAAGEVQFGSGTTTILGAYTVTSPSRVNGGVAAFSSPTPSTTVDLIVSGGRLEGTGQVDVTGNLDWTGGEFGVNGGGTTRVDSAATYTISGTTKTHRNYTLLLDGAGVWTAGNINAGSGAVFSVGTNGTLDVQGDVVYSYNLGGTGPRVDIVGTLLRTTGTGTVNVNAPFNNDGTLDLQSGTMTLTQGGVSDGQFLVSAGAVLGFNGGTHTLDSNSTLTAAGEVQFASGTTTILGAYTVTSPTRVNGGVAAFSSPTPSTTVNLIVSSGRVEGTGQLDVTGDLDWTGGEFGVNGGGTTRVDSAATYTLSGTTKTHRNYTLFLDGTGVWTAGNINSGSGAVLSIGPNGSFDVQGNLTNSYNLGGAAPLFDNAGTVTRSTGTGTATLNVPVNNAPGATVDVQTGTLAVSQGTTWNGSVTVAAGTSFDLTAGTHSLVDGFAVTGPAPARVAGATMTIPAAATATFDSLTLASGTITGDGTVDVLDAFLWTGGAVEAAATGGLLRITGTATATLATGTKTLRRILENNGVMTWTGGQINTGSSGRLVNNTTFDIQGNLTFSYNLGGTAPLFDNTGTVTRSTGTGTATLNVPVNNAPGATVDVQTGTLAVSQGTTWDGSVTVAAGTSFDLTAGTHSLVDGFAVTGPAPARVAGATMTIPAAATATFDSLTLASGTITGDGTVDVLDAFLWTGGAMEAAATGGLLRIAGTATATLSTGTKTLRRILENNGVMTWTGGQINTGSSALLDNNTTFDIQGNLSFSYNLGGTAPLLDNAGTITRSSGTGTATINVPINNALGATVDVQTGTLAVGQNSTWDGAITLAGGTIFDFTGSTHTLVDGFGVTGPAPARVAGAILTIPTTETAAFDELTLASGVITGDGTIDVLDAFIWSGGALEGATTGGLLRVGGAATATLSTGTKTLRRILENNGVMNWTGGQINTGSSGTLNNNATFDIQVDQAMSFNLGGTAPAINNAAVIVKSAGIGTATLNLDVSNTATASIDVQTGTLMFSRNVNLPSGAIMLGNGTIDVSGGTVTALDGTIQPGASPGVLGWTGNYSPGTGGTLDMEIEGGAPGVGAGFHDQLNITGVANLDGDLNGNFINTPVWGDVHQLITFGSSTGAFATMTSSGALPTAPSYLDLRLFQTSISVGVSDSINLGVGSFSRHIAINDVTDSTYVSVDDSLMVIDNSLRRAASGARMTPTTPPALAMLGVGVNTTTNTIYAGDINGQVHVFNGSNRAHISSPVVGTNGGRAVGIAVDVARALTYVSAEVGAGAPPVPTVRALNSINQIANSVTVGFSPGEPIGHLVYNPTNDQIYAAVGGAVVVAVDATTFTIQDSIPIGIGSGTDHMAVNPVTNHVYASNITANTVTVINAATNSFVATIPVGNGPEGISVDVANDLLFVANELDSDFSVVDVSNPASPVVLGTIDLPAGPIDAFVHPATGVVYVTNGEWVSVVRP